MTTCRLHRLVSTLLLAGCALLTGCGPGVGGTGTGATVDPASFGATDASVCAAPFAALLNCPVGAGVPGSPTALMGTDLARFADLATGGNASAVFDANRLRFDARCLALQFSGAWGLLASGEGRFFGSYSNPAGADILASMRVTGANPGELQVTLFNALGQVVLSPVALQAVDAPVTNPAACP